MKGSLTWYRLSFPRDLTSEAVVAALASFSGAPRRTRFIFELSATASGTTHRLAVTASSTEIVAAGLRSAIPSLRLDQVEPLPLGHSRRLLWQLDRPNSVIRSDELASITGGVLASLWPLGEHESVRLLWKVRTQRRPGLHSSANSRGNGQAQTLRRKLAGPGLGAYGELHVEAEDNARADHLLRRIGSPLASLSTPYGTLLLEPYWWGQLMYLLGLRGRYLSAHELAAVIAWPVGEPDLPGLELGAAKRLVPAMALADTGRILGTSDFAGMNRQVALSHSAATRGLYILGPTGTGKTSLLKSIIRADLEQGLGLAVVETNGDLINDLLDLIPRHRINDVVLLDPTDPEYAVGFNPFASSADPSLVADQLGELFQRLWKDFWGPRTGQLAHMSLLTLARREGSTLLDVPRLFLDPTFRASVLADLDDPLGLEPDWRWFNSLPPREQATVIAPLMNKVRQFTARSSIRGIIGQARPAISMPQIMAERKVLLVNLPKGLLGSETAMLLGCMVLTAVWQAATERARLPFAERSTFGLYVDEVQDFASAPIPFDEVLAQGRKYGLALAVAHQNLEQIPRELREAVLANARSQVAFALSPSDARVMARRFEPALSAADLQALDAYSVAALIALDDGSTARPVTLRTPFPPQALGSAEAVRQASRRSYAQPRARVEAELRAQAKPALVGVVGRKPRAR